MFPVQNPAQLDDSEDRPLKRRATDDIVNSALGDSKGKGKASAEIVESLCDFTSVRELRLAAGKGGSSGTFCIGDDCQTDLWRRIR
jgi:hypothetical protein